MEGFNAHSSRGAAATAAAMAGISTQEILSRAGWSNKDTFRKFYYRPTEAEGTARRFGQAILSYEQAYTTRFFSYELSMKFKIFHEKTHERHSWKFTFP